VGKERGLSDPRGVSGGRIGSPRPAGGRIETGAIREVIARTDIGALIGTYVQLRKRGNDLVGLCPFHGERTPSFHVHPDRGFFKCFGCGVGGDAIAFVERIENVPFPEALRSLAKRAGVELEPEDPRAARVRSEKEAIYEANAAAAALFHRLLKSDPRAKRARDYCEKRGITEASIDAFRLGFAPDTWDTLTAAFAKDGIDVEVAVKAGLLKRGQHGHYDFYRDRLMIPMSAATGEIVAFGGRALGDGEPKYLNTSTTPVYTKGKALFALNVARRFLAGGEALIVVEGYLDCIALHQAGFPQAVASLGTAFTPDQAAELRKYGDRAYLCFDADAAGSSATAKSIDVLVEAGVFARIVSLPPGEDPDSFVRAHGAAAFRAALDASIPWIQYKLDRSADGIRSEFSSPAAIAREAERLVRSLPQEEWDRWRVYVAQRLGLSADDLRATRFLADRTNFAAKAGSFTGHVSAAARPRSVEDDILATLLEDPALIREYAPLIGADRFSLASSRRLYELLVAHAPSLTDPSDVAAALGEDREAIALLSGLQDAERSAATRFADTPARRLHLDRIVESLAEADAERRRDDLNRQIDDLLATGAEVPQTVRDEYQLIVATVDNLRRKRVGTKH
jgi:DNA primase